MDGLRRFSPLALAAAVAAMMTFLVLGAMSDRFLPRALTGNVRVINEASCRMEDGRTESVSLPHTFKGLPPRAKVEFFIDLDVMPDDTLMIKMFYSPLRVYLDDELCFESGQEGDYPVFLRDPPTILELIRVPRDARTLRLEYLSPSQRDRLEAQAIYVGNELALYAKLFRDSLLSLAVSLCLLFFGFMTILLTFFLLRDLPKARALPWLGLFAISAGMWGLAECDFTLFLVPYPTLLYVLAFVGLYSIPIPYLVYGIMVMNPVHKRPLQAMLFFDTAALTGALALQASGVADFARTMPLFHISVPVSFFVFSVVMALEYRSTKKWEARRFAYSLLLLAVFASLEVVNYRMRFTDTLSLFFGIGVVLFIFDLGLTGGQFVRKSIETTREKDRLETEMNFMSRMLNARRHEYARLAETASKIASARHDLRHQLAVIRRYNADGDSRGLENFLDEISGSVKPPPGPICENYAVGAVTEHYMSIARDNGVEPDVKLDIPARIGRVQDMDFCIITGNLLENAVEACLRTRGPRFVRVRSRIFNDTLSLMVENSFDGTWLEKDGAYLSLKRGTGDMAVPGIGISSVKEICHKYDGMLRFDIRNNIWRASALVDLTGHLAGSDE